MKTLYQQKHFKRNNVSIIPLVLSHDSSNDVSQENVFWEHVFCENHIPNNVKGLQFQRDSTLQAAFSIILLEDISHALLPGLR